MDIPRGEFRSPQLVIEVWTGVGLVGEIARIYDLSLHPFSWPIPEACLDSASYEQASPFVARYVTTRISPGCYATQKYLHLIWSTEKKCPLFEHVYFYDAMGAGLAMTATHGFWQIEGQDGGVLLCGQEQFEFKKRSDCKLEWQRKEIFFEDSYSPIPPGETNGGLQYGKTIFHRH